MLPSDTGVFLPPHPTMLTTSKHFKLLPPLQASLVPPTGVHEYRRVRLSTVLPSIGGISLWDYYYLKIACCGHLLVVGESKLQDCERCHDNRGYVCPHCLGATWVTWRNDRGAELVPCPGCRIETVGEKGKLESSYDPDKELDSVRAWLVRRFPYGVPAQWTSERDLQLADGL